MQALTPLVRKNHHSILGNAMYHQSIYGNLRLSQQNAELWNPSGPFLLALLPIPIKGCQDLLEKNHQVPTQKGGSNLITRKKKPSIFPPEENPRGSALPTEPRLSEGQKMVHEHDLALLDRRPKGRRSCLGVFSKHWCDTHRKTGKSWESCRNIQFES